MLENTIAAIKSDARSLLTGAEGNFTQFEKRVDDLVAEAVAKAAQKWKVIVAAQAAVIIGLAVVVAILAAPVHP